MSNIFIICGAISMLAVVGVLAAGLISMARGGEFKDKYGNKLMQARVGLQGLALLMFALAYFTY